MLEQNNKLTSAFEDISKEKSPTCVTTKIQKGNTPPKKGNTHKDDATLEDNKCGFQNIKHAHEKHKKNITENRTL